MEVVVDSNILFSALISGKQVYLDIFRAVDVYIPDFVFPEIEKYEQRILRKTRLGNTFREFTRDLFTDVTVIPKLAISPDSLARAYELCRDIDEKDTPFLALSIELDIPLWTNDKSLSEGLRNKGYNKLLGSDDIFAFMGQK